MPCVQIGHNRFIAWGITAALCDDVEIYREKLHRLDPDLYRVGHRWQKLESRKELIAVRGAKPLEKIVRASRHGPAISDFRATSDGKEILTARWTAHEPSRELNSLYNLNCARDWKQFQDSLRLHAAPSLNFVYADHEGNIGYTLAGKIPRRASVPSLLPVAGWDERNDWLGYIPFDELPHVYNPPEGVVASANNRIADAAYPYYLSHFFDPPYRIRRIEQLLGQREKYSLGGLAALQLDHVSLHARDLIGALKTDLVRIADDNRIRQSRSQSPPRVGRRLCRIEHRSSDFSFNASAAAPASFNSGIGRRGLPGVRGDFESKYRAHRSHFCRGKIDLVFAPITIRAGAPRA